MKGTIIKDCLDCPHSDIANPEIEGGTLICELGNLNRDDIIICKMISYNYEIPEWCPLMDLQEAIDAAACDYEIIYKGKWIRGKKMETDKEDLKKDAKLMLDSFVRMNVYLKVKKDKEGQKIFSDVMIYTGIFFNNLSKSHREIATSMENEECLKTKD